MILGGGPTASGGTSPYTYDWTPALSGANPVVGPTGPTTYSLLITDVNNCTSSDTVSVDAYSVPSAGFTFSTTLLTANFTDASTGGVVSWSWDFGDGGTSTVASPSHTYAADGNYLVCLTVLNSTGCESMSCDTVTVIAITNTSPQASATFQVSPNPWSQSAMIRFDLTGTTDVQLEVYDLQGRLLTTLHDGTLGAGPHQFELKESALGSTAGTHLVKLTLNGRSTSQTIVHLH
jgi:PKD repeat protein